MTKHGGGSVLEAGRDGAFDVDELSERASELDLQASETLREKGNAAFQSKSFELSITFYTKAVEKNPHNHFLFSNRSAAFYHLQKYESALDDAQRAITLAPKWPKAFARKAAACEALHKYAEAIAAHTEIVELERSSQTTTTTSEARKAATKIQQLQELISKGRGKPSPPHTERTAAVQKGFFHQPKVKQNGSGMYKEKEEIVQQVVDKTTGLQRNEQDDERTWRHMLHRLKTGCNKQGINANGANVVLDDGVFAKLLQEHEFQKLIYPGIPKEQLIHAPQNLQALLEDPWYEDELVSLMPAVQKKAHSVLTNVKTRGAARGEIMDQVTEQMLLPQVLQEAFGREVLAMVHRINYKKHQLLANDSRTIADRQADEAKWDQLPETFLEELFCFSGHEPGGQQQQEKEDRAAGVAVLDEYMGQEWVQLIQQDAQRMAKDGKLMEVATSGGDLAAVMTEKKTNKTNRSTSGKMRFLEKAECAVEYPAIAELIEKLHALPFEINAKRPMTSQSTMTLCAQFAHCTALHQLQSGDHQKLRLDCGVGEKDNGFKLTCVYFISGGPVAELKLRTQLEVDARVQVVKSVADRLVIFHSQRVFNEMAMLPQDGQEKDLMYMVFWIHGKENTIK